MRLTDILSYLFKFKLSFVRELVLFEKWNQEASHTQCLQGSVENLGLRPRFSTPRASLSVFNTSLNLMSHTQCLQGSVENLGLPLGFQHFFKPPDCKCKLIGGLNMILPSIQIFFCEKYHLSSFRK